MKNKKLNLFKLLKGSRKGIKLYSPICGECTLFKVINNLIEVKDGEADRND